jgi:hypothetical protein
VGLSFSVSTSLSSETIDSGLRSALSRSKNIFSTSMGVSVEERNISVLKSVLLETPLVVSRSLPFRKPGFSAINT